MCRIRLEPGVLTHQCGGIGGAVREEVSPEMLGGAWWEEHWTVEDSQAGHIPHGGCLPKVSGFVIGARRGYPAKLAPLSPWGMSCGQSQRAASFTRAKDWEGG